MRRLPAALLALALAGCLDSPIDPGFSASGVGGGATGEFGEAAGASLGRYAVLELSSGAMATASSLPDLATDARYRTTHVAFRAVEDGDGPRGSATTAAFGAQSDEEAGTIRVTRYFLAVFELTQAQWQAIAGTTPWTAISPRSLAAEGADRPAVGMSLDEAAAALSAWNRGGHRLLLPTADQWEHACRAGSSASFPWGEGRDDAVVALHAVTSEVLDGVDGARPVGGRQANAFGFHDMPGNVWELTAGGELRGGSWRDTLAQARSANHGPVLDAANGHALVGLRLVLAP